MRNRHLATHGRMGLALMAVAGWLALSAANAPTHADILVVQGSTTFNFELISGHQNAIEAASRHSLTVIANKSNLGLLALFKGEADLAMISTSLANEAEILQRSNPDLPTAKLKVFAIARTQAALITHPTNTVQSISSENLRRVLLGEITDWRELGGAPMAIRVVAVREGGGVVSSVEASVLGPGKHLTAPNQIRVQNGSQIIKIVEQEPSALGITQVKMTAGHQLKRLATTVPIEQQLNLVSLGEPTPAMLDVIAACREVAANAGLE
jgi:phosphate transport system substrate-binding protein